MFMVNTPEIAGKTIIKSLGLVSGTTVRSKHIGRDIMADFKNIFGGELKGYSALLNETRNEAVARMQKEAKRLGANAIVNVRFSSSAAQGTAEIYVYGTAVIVQ